MNSNESHNSNSNRNGNSSPTYDLHHEQNKVVNGINKTTKDITNNVGIEAKTATHPSKIHSLTKGVFLLLLAVSGNFVAETLGCNTHKLLKTNMFAKHLLVFMILYFTISFTSNDDAPDPKKNLIAATLVYGFFIMFTRMRLNITIYAFFVLMILYLLSEFITYYTSHPGKVPPNRMEILTDIQKTLYFLLPIIVLYGFIVYMYDEYRVNGKNKSKLLKIIFGVPICKYS
tara:strand:- start:1044 stop:1733 length:690 start_codon:yes stop_codon:yes gene_type:complete